MTKEELAQKIAQREYTDCQRDSKYSVSFRIGGAKASVSKIGNNFVAMTVISTCISEEDYKRMLREALNNEMECLRREADAIRKEISDL